MSADRAEAADQLDYAALGRAIARRRKALRLTQDLSGRGGPGDVTVRRIEHGKGGPLRSRTLSQIENALSWPPGTADLILDGTIAEDDLTIESVVPPPAVSEAGDRALRIGNAVLILMQELAVEIAAAHRATS